MTEFEELFDQAEQNYDEGNFEEAIELYSKALEIESNNLNVLINLGLSFYNVDKNDKAITLYKKAISIEPEDFLAWINLGLVYLDEESYEDAIKAFKVASELDSEDPEIWEHLGEAYFYIGEYEKSRQSFRNMILDSEKNVVRDAVLKALFERFDVKSEAGIDELETYYEGEALISIVNISILSAKSSITIFMPNDIIDIMECCLDQASNKNDIKIILIGHWDFQENHELLKKLYDIENIELRKSVSELGFLSVLRDDEELLIAIGIGDSNAIGTVRSIKKSYIEAFKPWLSEFLNQSKIMQYDMKVIKGIESLISVMKKIIPLTKTSLTLITPFMIPKLLTKIPKLAMMKKSVKITLISYWDVVNYGEIITKLLNLGNITFRHSASQINYYVLIRDDEEVVFTSTEYLEGFLIGFHSNHPSFCEFYRNMIGPMFFANSRPIKSEKKEPIFSEERNFGALKINKIIKVLDESRYKIILIVENTEKSPTGKFIVIDVVPADTEYGDYSQEPEISDEYGPDTLEWNVSSLGSGDKLEISYNIEPFCDFESLPLSEPLIKIISQEQICPKCGFKTDPRHLFCKKCGAKFS